MATTLQLTLRRALMKAIIGRAQGWCLDQDSTARKLGLFRSRYSALLNGHVEVFSLDTLVAIAAKAGLRVRVSAVRPYGTR